MKNCITSQAAIKKAIERDVHDSLLQESKLINLSLSNRQIDKMLRIPWQDRCRLEKHGIIPASYGKRVFYYSPLDIPNLITSNNELLTDQA